MPSFIWALGAGDPNPGPHTGIGPQCYPLSHLLGATAVCSVLSHPTGPGHMTLLLSATQLTSWKACLFFWQFPCCSTLQSLELPCPTPTSDSAESGVEPLHPPFLSIVASALGLATLTASIYTLPQCWSDGCYLP